MIILTDQSGRIVSCPATPVRVVSLVPSMTETVAECMGEEVLVGVTKFCVHPSTLRRKVKVIGGTKNPNIALIRSLKPDIVLANKEENRKEDIDLIQQFCPVYVSDIKDMQDVTRWLDDMNMLFSAPKFRILSEQVASLYHSKKHTGLRTLYLIWQNPYMSVGGDTFIHSMMAHFGMKNVFGEEVRYPVLALDAIRERKPEVILLSSEPYPFTDKHVHEFQSFFPESRVLLADGELFSWYGSRMLVAHKEISGWLGGLFDN